MPILREDHERKVHSLVRALSMVALLGAACLAPACSSSGDGGSGGKDKSKTGQTVGIDPIIYKCENLVTPEQVGEALGGKAELMQVAFEPPPGMAEPCNYMLSFAGADAGSPQPWSFDMDCRPSALKEADKLFEQYKKSGVDDAGALTNETRMVQIGRKAMDHHGQALLAVDDDTDCYVRIMGPTEDGRTALGTLVIENLEWRNAPMRPRAM